MSTMTAGRTRIESVALTRVRQERLRQLGVRSSGAAEYVPRHRADGPVDSAA